MTAKTHESQAWILGIITLVIAVYLQFAAGVSWDKEWLMLAAQGLLRHKVLDVDYIEVNPPLIVWLYTIPAILASVLQISTAQAVTFFGFIAAGAAMILSIKILRHASRDLPALTPALLIFIFLVFPSPIIFADRDYLFITLTFPYLLYQLPSVARPKLPRALRYAAGSMAAIGFCIKPHCMLVLAGVILYDALRRKDWRPVFAGENIVIYAVILAYLAAIFIFVPEYVHLVWPMAIATYGKNGSRLIGILNNVPLSLLLLGICLADWRPRDVSPYRGDIIYLLYLEFLVLLYALANNGWGYNYYPLQCITLFTCGWLGMHHAWLRRNLPDKRHVYGVRASIVAAIIAILVMSAGFFGASSFRCEDSPSCRRDKGFISMLRSEHAGSFGIFSINFLPWPYYRIAANAEWELRFNHYWMLTSSFMKGDAGYTHRNRWILDYVAHATAEDLMHRKPELIFNDVSPVFKARGDSVDIIGLLSTYPDFAQAWGHYHPVKTLDFCDLPQKGSESSCRYEVYRRID